MPAGANRCRVDRNGSQHAAHSTQHSILTPHASRLTPALSGVFAPLAAEVSGLVEELRRSVVLIQAGAGHGSGLIWDSDGLIVTNHHVVDAAGRGRTTVELTDGRCYPATVVACDPYNDLAALRVQAHGLPAAAIGDSTVLRVGELIIAVGNPFGVRGAATLGIVSATGGGIRLGRARREVLQADVALAPGNSGGPLADATGHVVGIASMVLSPGIALAVPSHVVRRFVRPFVHDAAPDRESAVSAMV